MVWEGCYTLTVKPWEGPHIRLAVWALLESVSVWDQPVAVLRLVSVLTQSLTPTSVSCVPACDWLSDWVWAFLLLTWEEGRCVCVWERKSHWYTPFSSLAPSPCSPLPHDSSLESVCVFACACYCLALGHEAFSEGCTDCHTAMSGSDIYIFIPWQSATPSSGEVDAYLCCVRKLRAGDHLHTCGVWSESSI